MKTFAAVFLNKPCLLIYRYRNDKKNHRALISSPVFRLTSPPGVWCRGERSASRTFLLKEDADIHGLCF